ncbi:nucleotidyltransferase domain-containing protein [Candidatus Pacearchaeota archaeon]|nr:nucleotidyltransferase domain-containing protein [Candidatus Pacearchaeota archaeon]
MDQDQDTILQEVLDIIKEDIDLSEIMGVYLVGSYAREDYTEKSDIDILIITEKTDLELIKNENYEILTISLDLLNYKLKEDLLPIGTMLKEAKPLLNSNFLSCLDIKVTKRNVKWYLETTKDRLKLIKESIDTIKKKKPNGKLSDIIAYSLILRLRTIYMINCLKENKPYHKSEFLELVKKVSGSLVSYDRYIYEKGSEDHKRELPLSEGERLYEYLKEYLKKTIKNVENSKK